MATDRYDTIVVGAGILGLAVARELLARRPSERVLVLEREPAPAAHQSSHNSGVVHGGVYYAPGSLKARLCVDGAARMVAYCEAHGIAVRRLGKLVVALRPDELPALDELERRARANGVSGVRRVGAAGLRGIEPHAAGIAALHAPGTSVIDFGAEAGRYVPLITPGDLVPAFAGVRAQAVARDGRLVDDFVLSATPRAIHVRNAPSPAATSSLALASLIADRAERLA